MVSSKQSESARPMAIEAQELCQQFGKVTAVDRASFSVPAGHVVGFVGENGAGKTTTMRILATLDHPSSGIARIGGYDVMQYPNEVRSLLGWMPDDFGTYSDMTGREYLDFFARAYGYRGAERRSRVADVIDFTELHEIADRYIDKLSKGMGQRLCLGRALIHDPEILIMDEPAAGLDPRARIDLKNLIRLLAEEGKTVLISSHILSELGEMCDSLLFINRGRIIHHGQAEDLTEGHHGGEATVIDVQVLGDPHVLQSWADMNPDVSFVDFTKNGGRLEVSSTDRAVMAAVLRQLVLDGIEVTGFRRQERRLEDAFVDIVGKGGIVPPPPGKKATGDGDLGGQENLGGSGS
jgi:ABC-2 type transport system ATP-binding protein